MFDMAEPHPVYSRLPTCSRRDPRDSPHDGIGPSHIWHHFEIHYMAYIQDTADPSDYPTAEGYLQYTFRTDDFG